jgi:hypothetical protein
MSGRAQRIVIPFIRGFPAERRLPMERPTNIRLDSLKYLDADRAVAHVTINDEISLKTLFCVGISKGRPTVSWPQSKRGFPIVEASPGLRERVDKVIIDGL